MPKVKISEYSATANSNTDVASINIDEGCAPSGINNAIRAVMGHLKDFQQGTYGDPFNGPVNGTVGATTANTGAFTTLSASGIITSTATAGQVVKAESGTTGILYSNFANTGGTFLYGIDNSAGTALFSGSAAYAGFIGTSGARPLVLATNGAGRAFIDSSGNVGIGTSNPTQKLTVDGVIASIGPASSLTASSVFIDYNTTSNLGRLAAVGNTTGTAAPIYFSQYSSNASVGRDAMIIDSSGNLGIGTSSPTCRLQVSGSAFITGTRANPSAGSGLELYQDGTNCYLLGYNRTTSAYMPITSDGSLHSWYINGVEKMRLDSTGIVTMSAYGAGAATFSAAGVISSVSDETWKIKDGVPVDPDSMLKKLEPGYWYYNEEKASTFGADRQLGFYAQNVNAAIGPEAAPTPEEGKPWGYYDRSVLAVTVMSLQKALATIETLTARITALEGA